MITGYAMQGCLVVTQRQSCSIRRTATELSWGDKWIKVEDKETVSKLIGWIQTERQFIPRLWRILGPDNQFYGYLFYALNDAVIKVVDDTTLYV